MTSRPDTSATAPGEAGKRRREYDAHVSGCTECVRSFARSWELCNTGEALWRRVVLAANKAGKEGA